MYMGVRADIVDYDGPGIAQYSAVGATVTAQPSVLVYKQAAAQWVVGALAWSGQSGRREPS